METPSRRYPKRLKAGSPSPVPQPPPLQSDRKRRKVAACPAPSPQSVATPVPISTPQPVATPVPIATPQPVAAPEPIATPQPVATPEPIATPQPVATPEPIATPQPVATPEPIATPPPVASSQPAVVVTAVQGDRDDLCSLPSVHDMCERNDTDPLASGCSSVQELPPSSSNLNVPASSLADLFSVYSYLRCFSRLLFLSPFSLEKFVTALCAERGDGLIDSVHFSLLEAVKRHYSSVDSSPTCFGDLNWDLLDLITWPVYLASFLMTQGYSKLRKKSLVKAGIGRGEYQKRVPVGEKLAMLSFLCEHALQSEDSRTEVSVRLMYAHQTIVEPTLQKPGEGDPEWRPQEAKPEGRAQETPLLRKASDRLLKSTEKGEWSKEVQRAATALGGDGNSNDCMICGMDGVLLCCDACPAAYHSRCVGISKSKLSTGDWFCPECRLICRGTPYSKRLQGAQLLGMGPLERYFLATCDYLLVTQVDEKGTRHWYYGLPELSSVLKYLQSFGNTYNELQYAIRQYWEMESNLLMNGGSRDNFVCFQETPPSSPTRAPLSRQSNRKKKKPGQLENGTSVQESIKKQTPAKPPASTTKTKTPASTTKTKTPASTTKTSNGTKHTPKQDGKGKPTKVHTLVGPYVNQYAHGDAVATAADTLATWQGGGDPAWVPGTRARGTSANEQVRAFTVALPSFSWPSNRKGFSEKCGWCGLCSSNSRGCLLVQTDVQVSRRVDDLKPLKLSKGVRHLGTVTAYVLHLEQTLHALLVGWPWELPLQRERWRTRLEGSPSVRAIKNSLLQLEAALRPIAMSTDWVKHPDMAPLLWPASMLKRQSNPWAATNEIPPTRRCGVQWRRGGRVARRICDWETLPLETLKRTARQGGWKPITGLLYSNDTNAVPQRTKQSAWRARVERASSVAQIALQVRAFDVQLKWRDLLQDAGGESKKPFIYGKTIEEGVPKYLVNMTEEEIENEKQNRDTQPLIGMHISPEGLKQVWKTEQQLPLCQVKFYEEKLFAENLQKASHAKKPKGGNKQKGKGLHKKRTLNVVLGKLLDAIKLQEKRTGGKKQPAKSLAKSPAKPPAKGTPDRRKSQGSPARPQCQRCKAFCEKASLSKLEGVLVCGRCLQQSHGKRLRRPSTKVLEMLEEPGSDGSSPPKAENGKVAWTEDAPLWKEESPPLKLEWSGTSLRKSGRKRKRVNLKGPFAWQDPYEGPGATENGTKRTRYESGRFR